jgi:hypothetical protein
MIIKTITCHEVYNHGASLQEYALLVYLNSLGHEAEAIHYKPSYLSRHFKFDTVSNPKFDKPFIKQLYLLAKLPGRIRDLQRKKVFDAFAKQHIPTGTTLYRNNADLKADLPVADAFICGSDQIWNSFFDNGKDPAFYLNFVPKSKIKISYAASFAQDEIAEEVKQLVKENVANLDAISVRETSGISILKDLGIKNVIQVLDPVFLLGAGHWKSNFVTPIREKYLFIYDSDNNQQIKRIAKAIAKEKKLRIYTVDKGIDYSDKKFYFDGPNKFLSLIYYSEFVLTNSFHALSFSLIFNKKFLVFNRKEKINTRMRDLMLLTETDFLLIKEEDNYEPDLITMTIDYIRVNKILNHKIDESKLYLALSLK